MTTDNHNSACAAVMSLAERELSAFFTAVAESYGTEQATISAEDWIDQLELVDETHAFTARDWRSITIATAARLARRLIEGAASRR